jgi:hypothetical protein
MKITILISQFGDNSYALTGIKPKLLKYQHFFKKKKKEKEKLRLCFVKKVELQQLAGGEFKKKYCGFF